nr:MAG TPA: hypothetical protein [Caudoviricetes sp.]
MWRKDSTNSKTSCNRGMLRPRPVLESLLQEEEVRNSYLCL